MRLVHIDVAGGARAGAAALGLDVETPVADHLHYAPALEPFKLVLDALGICDEDLHRLLDQPTTPSLRCSLVEEVVYWKTTRSSGEAIFLAACAMSAPS